MLALASPRFTASRSIARSLARSFSVSTLDGDNAAVQTFLADNKLAVLYYTATWCPPCKAIKPIYERLSTEYPDVAFGKIDVDENPEASAEAAISAVPTFLFVNDKNIKDRFSGADEASLKIKLDSLQN